MRGFRSTLVLLAIFVGLVGYIYFYMMKKPPDPEQGDPTLKLFAVDADKIEEVAVKAASGERTVLRKVDGAWEIVEPQRLKADENEATGIVTNLASLQFERVVDENPGDIAQYGLASPRVEIGFRAAGQKGETRLLLGDKTATASSLYAKLPGAERVVLVPAFLDTTFNRGTFDLRDKAILTFVRDKVDAVEIVTKGRALALALSDARWRLTKPLVARADTSAVDGLIGRLQTARMTSVAFADASEQDLARYGLDKPEVSATVGAGSARATLAIGKAAESGTLYARDVSRPMVFTVESALADDLKKQADQYRPKDVFDFRPFMATRFEVARGSSVVAFEKTKAKDGQEKWRMVSPSRDVDTAKMDALLSGFSSMSVSAYVDAGTKTGADAPAAVVTVTFDDGKREERVTIGRVGSDVYAMRPGEPGAAKLDAASLDEALKALDALK